MQHVRAYSAPADMINGLSGANPDAPSASAGTQCLALSRLTPCVKAHKHAFTLIELLVVIAIIAILAAILMPVLNLAQEKARIAQCLNNKKQMAMGWVMYANDQPGGEIMPNADSATHVGGNAWVEGILSWAPDNLDNVNTNYLANSLLGNYCSQVVKIYKCPDDVLQCQEASPLPSMMDRVRSVSMNGFLEGGIHDADKGKAGIPIQVDYFVASNGGPDLYSYDMLSQINGTHGPGTADMIVFTDENCNSLDDGFFMPLNPGSTGVSKGQISASAWENLPGDYHDKDGDTIGFADGHCEFHKWLSSYTCVPPAEPNPLQFSDSIGNKFVDFNWVVSHSTAAYP